MSEKEIEAVKEDRAETDEERQRRQNAEKRAELEKQRQEERERLRAAMEVMSEGKGCLELKKPIKAGEKELRELIYDFTELTGLDYTEAMDTGGTERNLSSIGYRQGLALFAKAVSVCMRELDMKDVVSRIGAADAAEGVELAGIFFNASILAGRRRISKKS